MPIGSLEGLRTRLDGIVAPEKIVLPPIDETFALTPTGARVIEDRMPPRIDKQKVAQLDWYNDVSRLILDMNDALTQAADEEGERGYYGPAAARA
jgi:metallo-beta-lactamase family protein